MKDMNDYFPEQCKDGISHYVPDAWFKTVHKTIEQLIEIEPQIKFIQIKSKFNTLRMYVDNVRSEKYKEVNDVISKAEDRIEEIENGNGTG